MIKPQFDVLIICTEVSSPFQCRISLILIEDKLESLHECYNEFKKQFDNPDLVTVNSIKPRYLSFTYPIHYGFKVVETLQTILEKNQLGKYYTHFVKNSDSIF